jgi:hypothetical protein
MPLLRYLGGTIAFGLETQDALHVWGSDLRPSTVALVLLPVGTVWAGYLAAFNWWAAGGPPTPYRDAYEWRGNVFGIVSLSLAVAFVAVVVRSIRRQISRTRGGSA